MPDSLRLDTANLVGLIMQAFFYGVFQVLFIACIYVLIYRRKTDHFNWYLLSTACLMWILIGVNFALSWSRIMDAFIVLQPAMQSNLETINDYFEDLGNWKEITRTGVYIGLTAVADSLFIYRCYVVWGRSKSIIIIPLVLLCGSITCGIGVEVLIAAPGSTTNLFSTNLAIWATSFFTISLVQNVLTTCLIIYRVWRVHLGVREFCSESMWPVMAVLLESGAIYSSNLIVLLFAYVSGSFAQYIALDVLVPVIGVVFSMIIVRVGLGLSQTSGLQIGSAGPSAIRFPMENMGIRVTRTITVESDLENGETKDDVSETLAVEGGDDGSERKGIST